MKILRWSLILFVLGALLVLFVPSASLFWGGVTRREICMDCGQVRSSEGLWLFGLRWIRTRGDPGPTPVSKFRAGLGGKVYRPHRWRRVSESRQFGMLLAAEVGEERRTKTVDRVLPEERTLGGIEPEIALCAVQQRLWDPRYDGGLTPPWFSAPGWPPGSAEEARAWWKGAKP